MIKCSIIYSLKNFYTNNKLFQIKIIFQKNQINKIYWKIKFIINKYKDLKIKKFKYSKKDYFINLKFIWI